MEKLLELILKRRWIKMVDKVKCPSCPKCGTFMDKVVAYTCSKCGGKTKKKVK